MEDKIKCSIGVLTFNSEEYLERCLKSVKDFDEIVIADGGSTDKTLEIAKKYNCKIIQQSNPGNPIEDFSVERNRMLDAALYDWFFYLDSDEIMSEELSDDIRKVVDKKNIEFLVYRVRYQLVSEDLGTRYRSFKNYYQTRFFNKKSGARFIKKMHEKISFGSKHKVGVVEGSWLVPLDTQLDFKVYKIKVQYRLGVMVENSTIKNPFIFFRKAVFEPAKNIVKQLIKMFYLRIRYKKSEIVPFKYEFYRLYSQFVFIGKIWKKYLKL